MTPGRSLSARQLVKAVKDAIEVRTQAKLNPKSILFGRTDFMICPN
jgi:hypothetical protein